jgi:hypothetical protein
MAYGGLLLFIKLNNYFILFFNHHLSLRAECFISIRLCPLASAADTSVDRCLPPSSTAIAQCLRLLWRPQSWSALTVSFFNFLCAASFALALAASRQQS